MAALISFFTYTFQSDVYLRFIPLDEGMYVIPSSVNQPGMNRSTCWNDMLLVEQTRQKRAVQSIIASTVAFVSHQVWVVNYHLTFQTPKWKLG